MPRKFLDNELVRVVYSSRRMSMTFFGRVEGYDKDYIVRYLGGAMTPKQDMLFDCKVHELSAVSNEFIDAMKYDISQQHRIMLSNWVNGNGAFGWRYTQTNLVWQSFALQRLNDNAWSRQFPITDRIGRTNRVYC